MPKLATSGGGRRTMLVIIVMTAICLTAAIAAAQFGRGRFGFRASFASAKDFDGHFHFCRWVYQSALDGDGGNWNADWPRADINLSIRLSELTKADVSKDPSGEPNHLLVRFTNPEVFDCPFVMATEVGRTFIADDEAKAMRLYLEKGGFLWVDDFWGSYAWDHWVGQLRKALPANEFPIFDLPPDHPLFRTQFEVTSVPQIPNIELRAEQRMVRRQIEDRKFIRRQRLPQLANPVVPGVAAPEIIDPEKAAFLQVQSHRLRLVIGDERAADFRGHHERAVEDFRIREPNKQMVWLAARVFADIRFRQFGQANRQVDVGARPVGIPVAAVAIER
jgi:hypothetical protein